MIPLFLAVVQKESSIGGMTNRSIAAGTSTDPKPGRGQAKRSQDSAALVELARSIAPTEAQQRESVAMAAYLQATHSASQASELQTLIATLSSLPPNSPFADRMNRRIESLLNSMGT